MTIGAIGSCSDSSTNPLQQAAAELTGEERLSPVEEANRLAEESRELDTSGARDQRVNPTENAAKAGTTQNLTQAAQVNELRDGGAAAVDKADAAGQSAGAEEPIEREPAVQIYQAAEAGDDRFPNRGGVLDFQI
jgi:cell division protein FtsN